MAREVINYDGKGKIVTLLNGTEGVVSRKGVHQGTDRPWIHVLRSTEDPNLLRKEHYFSEPGMRKDQYIYLDSSFIFRDLCPVGFEEAREVIGEVAA